MSGQATTSHCILVFLPRWALPPIRKRMIEPKRFAWAIAPGILKEVIDSQEEGNQFSTKDLAWDALGALVGVQAGHWMIGDNKVSWVTDF